MSEEEIIKEVNMLIRFNEQDEKIAYSDFELMPNRKSYQALKGLLYLYNKEKEQNRVLINSINDLMKECNQENKRCTELAIELDNEKEKNKKYETSDYETICLENKHLLEQLEICQADLEEMTISNNHKKENWIHKDTLNSYILKSKLEEILDRYAYTKLDDEEKIIRFYKDLQELLEERN